jgi:hypothetical protein
MKKSYTKPVLNTVPLLLGVFGDYGNDDGRRRRRRRRGRGGWWNWL